MKINQFGECIVSEQEVISSFYAGKITDLSVINLDDNSVVQQVNSSIDKNADQITKLKYYVESTDSIEQFDEKNQKQWLIPQNYQNFDIANWLFEQCHTKEQQDRVMYELELFIQHSMIEVLLCLKYLVDYMRQHKIVWGLGRGSSVASYCLYLIGVHKVDSIAYNLDIKEFLKGE